LIGHRPQSLTGHTANRYCNELFIFAMVIGVNNLVIVLFITIKSQVDEINSTKM